MILPLLLCDHFLTWRSITVITVVTVGFLPAFAFAGRLRSFPVGLRCLWLAWSARFSLTRIAVRFTELGLAVLAHLLEVLTATTLVAVRW